MSADLIIEATAAKVGGLAFRPAAIPFELWCSPIRYGISESDRKTRCLVLDIAPSKAVRKKVSCRIEVTADDLRSASEEKKSFKALVIELISEAVAECGWFCPQCGTPTQLVGTRCFCPRCKWIKFQEEPAQAG